MKEFKVYLAAPLFSVGERAFNRRLASALEQTMGNLSIMLPQEYGNQVYGQDGFADKVFRHCIDSIREADAVLCVLEGSDADSGTCIEMGYAHACHKPIVGVRTDFRGSEDRGVNLMVSKVCQEMVWLPDSRLTETETITHVAIALKRVLPDM